MDSILNLRIYTPNKLIIDETIKKLTVYGNEGSFTILPKHIDYVSSFDDCMLYFTKNDGQVVFVGVNQGILVKSGREIQISTFNAVNGGNSLQELKDKLRLNIVSEDIKNKIKNSLQNIRKDLFNDIGKRYEQIRRKNFK